MCTVNNINNKQILNNIVVKCGRCKGRGYTNDVDIFCAVCTLGITALIDLSERKNCKKCNGTGYRGLS